MQAAGGLCMVRGAPPGAVLRMRLEGGGQVAERLVEAGRLVEGVRRAVPQRLHSRQRLAILPATRRRTHWASTNCDTESTRRVMAALPVTCSVPGPSSREHLRFRQAVCMQLLSS